MVSEKPTQWISTIGLGSTCILPSNDRVMHHGLVRLFLEVAVPSALEFWSRPFPHLCELLLRGTDLHTRFDTVGRQWAGTVDVPLVEDLFLNLRVAPNKVIKGLGIRLSTEHGEGKVVILEVETDTGEVHQRLYANLAQLLCVTDPRPLEDKRRAECASTDDDLFAGFEDPWLLLPRGQRLRGHSLHTDGATIFNDDLVDLGVALQVKVTVVSSCTMDVTMSRV